MMIGEAEFIDRLQSTPAQAAMVGELFRNPDFGRLWRYLRNCPHIRLTLEVTPGLTIGGVERFGVFDHRMQRLELNPSKREHLGNVAALAETLIHELIHAALNARERCGEKWWPLPAGASDWYHDSNIPNPGRLLPNKSSRASRNKAYIEKHYGDSVSNPLHEYFDQNREAQQFVVGIVTALLERTFLDSPGLKPMPGPTPAFRKLRKLVGAQTLTSNFAEIREIVWERNSCWRKLARSQGWIRECRCDWCTMILELRDGTKRVDLIDGGDRVERRLDTLRVARLAGWGIS